MDSKIIWINSIKHDVREAIKASNFECYKGKRCKGYNLFDVDLPEFADFHRQGGLTLKKVEATVKTFMADPHIVETALTTLRIEQLPGRTQLVGGQFLLAYWLYSLQTNNLPIKNDNVCRMLDIPLVTDADSAFKTGLGLNRLASGAPDLLDYCNKVEEYGKICEQKMGKRPTNGEISKELLSVFGDAIDGSNSSFNFKDEMVKRVRRISTIMLPAEEEYLQLTDHWAGAANTSIAVNSVFLWDDLIKEIPENQRPFMIKQFCTSFPNYLESTPESYTTSKMFLHDIRLMYFRHLVQTECLNAVQEDYKPKPADLFLVTNDSSEDDLQLTTHYPDLHYRRMLIFYKKLLCCKNEEKAVVEILTKKDESLVDKKKKGPIPLKKIDQNLVINYLAARISEETRNYWYGKATNATQNSQDDDNENGEGDDEELMCPLDWFIANHAQLDPARFKHHVINSDGEDLLQKLGKSVVAGDMLYWRFDAGALTVGRTAGSVFPYRTNIHGGCSSYIDEVQKVLQAQTAPLVLISGEVAKRYSGNGAKIAAVENGNFIGTLQSYGDAVTATSLKHDPVIPFLSNVKFISVGKYFDWPKKSEQRCWMEIDMEPGTLAQIEEELGIKRSKSGPQGPLGKRQKTLEKGAAAASEESSGEPSGGGVSYDPVVFSKKRTRVNKQKPLTLWSSIRSVALETEIIRRLIEHGNTLQTEEEGEPKKDATSSKAAGIASDKQKITKIVDFAGSPSTMAAAMICGGISYVGFHLSEIHASHARRTAQYLVAQCKVNDKDIIPKSYNYVHFMEGYKRYAGTSLQLGTPISFAIGLDEAKDGNVDG